jgi:sulfur-oxidizing protein SoxZ
MVTVQPRVQVPSEVAKGEVFEVRTLISHPMETGLRHDDSMHVIPRHLINKFTCRYNDAVVFSVDMHESVAANPYLSFYLRATESGRLQFIWEEDGGAVYSLASLITVRG